MNNVVIYLVFVNLLALILVFHDKKAARKKVWRVRERTLLIVSAIGGAAAMLLAMLVFRHKTRHMKFMLGIPLILSAQVVFFAVACDSGLSVSHYHVDSDKIDGRVKLALVSDLHSCDYGAGQKELLGAIDGEAPDAVLLCGDIFDDVLPPDKASVFAAEVAKKYPCFYVSGNHEFWSGKADEFKRLLRSYGIKVLEGTAETVEIHGDKIRICGVDDPAGDRYASKAAPYVEQIEGLRQASDDGIFTLLLSHRPERTDEFVRLKADLVLSGHAHGGQWRIPFILENGLVTPNQGLFPKYTNGEYFFGDTELIVSRGLARESTAIPRIFNRPEVVQIEICSGQKNRN